MTNAFTFIKHSFGFFFSNGNEKYDKAINSYPWTVIIGAYYFFMAFYIIAEIFNFAYGLIDPITFFANVVGYLITPWFTFISVGILHLLLLLFGAKGGFWKTFKYSLSLSVVVQFISASFLLLISLFGFNEIIVAALSVGFLLILFVFSIWNLVLLVIVMARVHNISILRTVMAIIVIPLVLGIIMVLIFIMLFAAIFATTGGAGFY